MLMPLSESPQVCAFIVQMTEVMRSRFAVKEDEWRFVKWTHIQNAQTADFARKLLSYSKQKTDKYLLFYSLDIPGKEAKDSIVPYDFCSGNK